MIQVNPLTKEEARRRSANFLKGTVSAFRIHAEELKDKPTRAAVDRLCDLLLRIKQRFTPTYEDAERLEEMLKDSMDDSDTFTVNLEGDRLFVSGYIKVNKFGKKAIW